MPNEETTPQAQSVPELVDDLMSRYEVVPRLSQTRVAHIHECYQALPSIAEYVRYQEAELTRLRGELEKVKQAACGNEDCNCCRVVYSIAHAALSPSPRATP